MNQTVSRAMNMLYLANKAGALVFGEEAVNTAGGRLVLIAASSDAGANVLHHTARAEQDYGTAAVRLPWSTAELGAFFGRGRLAVLGCRSAELAAAFVQRLAEEYPKNTEYSGIYAELKDKKENKTGNKAGKKPAANGKAKVDDRK